MTSALRRMVNGYCADRDIAGLPCDDSTLWEQAATEADATLQLAEDYLTSCVNPDDTRHSPTLLSAAEALAAAGDLLATHFGHQDDERSEWAEVIASGAVTRALAQEVASWSQRLAPWVRWLSEPDTIEPGARASLLAASRNMQLADRAAALAGKSRPVTEDDRTLLHALPAAGMAEPWPPRDEASVTQLCTGITLTAERLRFIAFHTADHAAWSPAISARTWQYTATAAAITMDTAALVLRTLADSRTVPGALLAAEPDGMRAADELTGARDALQRIAAALAGVATDTPPALTLEATDVSDLVICMGRLAFDNPRWTPQHRADPRSPAQLLSEPADAANILAAVHLSTIALTDLANGHWSAVATAIRAGRLYVPTRSLPERYDVPHRYAQMPPERAEKLIDIYTAAARTSAAAAESLSALVLATGGPSRHIALARQAIRRGETPDNQTADPGPAKSAMPSGPRLAQRLAVLGVADIDLTLRAAVIDKAAASLISEVDRRSQIQPTASSPGRPSQRRSKKTNPRFHSNP